MARQPLEAQTAGTVAVVLLARPTDGPGGETVVPGHVYATAAARRGLDTVRVLTIDSVREPATGIQEPRRRWRRWPTPCSGG